MRNVPEVAKVEADLGQLVSCLKSLCLTERRLRACVVNTDSTLNAREKAVMAYNYRLSITAKCFSSVDKSLYALWRVLQIVPDTACLLDGLRVWRVVFINISGSIMPCCLSDFDRGRYRSPLRLYYQYGSHLFPDYCREAKP